VRTFFGQEGWSSSNADVQISDFLTFMVCPHGQTGRVEPVQTFFVQGGVESVFRDFVRPLAAPSVDLPEKNKEKHFLAYLSDLFATK